MTLVVNLFGGPGQGKSTLAAGIFYELKQQGVNCELVTEFAKDMVWEESFKVLENQLYVFAQQSHRLFRLKDKVDVIIVDSPLLLNLYYGRNFSDTFKTLIKEVFYEYDNLCYLVEKEDRPYNEVGRMQTEEEAALVHKEVIDILENEQLAFKILRRSESDISSAAAVAYVALDVMRTLDHKEAKP